MDRLLAEGIGQVFFSLVSLCNCLFFSQSYGRRVVYSDLKLVLELLVVLLDLLTSPGSPRLRFQAGKRSFDSISAKRFLNDSFFCARVSLAFLVVHSLLFRFLQ